MIKNNLRYLGNHFAGIVGGLVVLFNGLGIAQVNLVPNPSFEEHVACPTNLNQVDSIVGWYNFGNTPDYLHVCGTPGTGVSVPYNFIGFQYPFSGSAYCALFAYAEGSNYREIIGSQLIAPLDSGITYYSAMYFNAAHWNNGGLDVGSNCAINGIGMRFGNVLYDEFSPHPIDNISNIYSSDIITDTAGWTMVFGSFTPSQTFQYVAIGNFFDSNNTDTIQLCPPGAGGNFAYYYVDDVVVSTDSAFAYNFASMKPSVKTSLINIFPNPASDICHVTLGKEILSNNVSIRLLDFRGVTLFQEKFSSNKVIMNLGDVKSGIYLLEVECGTFRTIEKLVVQ